MEDWLKNYGPFSEYCTVVKKEWGNCTDMEWCRYLLNEKKKKRCRIVCCAAIWVERINKYTSIYMLLVYSYNIFGKDSQENDNLKLPWERWG